MTPARNSLGPPRRIGLTGGIATGKTTVADYLAQRYQWPVLDADRYAREAVALGTPVLEAIAARYGADILQPDGQLDRRRLGDRVFQDSEERRWLEAQIFPVVRACFERDLAALAAKGCRSAVLAIPLLFEAGMTDLATEIWVVACSPEQQLARLQARDRLARDQAEARIASQMPLAAKIAAADRLLDNSGDRDRLFAQVDAAVRFGSAPAVE